MSGNTFGRNGGPGKGTISKIFDSAGTILCRRGVVLEKTGKKIQRKKVCISDRLKRDQAGGQNQRLSYQKAIEPERGKSGIKANFWGERFDFVRAKAGF